MANLYATQGCTRQGVLDLCDVVDDFCRVSTHTGIVFDARGRLPIEVFATDGEADDEIGERGAVCLDSGCQGRDLVCNVALSA